MKNCNWIFSLLILSLSFEGCVSQHEMLANYSMKSGYGKAILRIDSSRVVFIPYLTVGDGYSIHLGTYKVRGQKIILSLDSYIMRGGIPTQWEKGSKSRYKYKISPEGDLINMKAPNYSLYRDDSLSEDQLKLLEMAPSLVKKYPYPLNRI